MNFVRDFQYYSYDPFRQSPLEEDDIEHCTVIPDKDICLEPGNVMNMKFTDAHVVSNEHSEVGYTINL